MWCLIFLLGFITRLILEFFPFNFIDLKVLYKWDRKCYGVTKQQVHGEYSSLCSKTIKNVIILKNQRVGRKKNENVMNRHRSQ